MPKVAPSSAGAHRRQRPVSCRFCRTRKLRCSREAPCSNCVSRGIQCDLEQNVLHPPNHDRTPPRDYSVLSSNAEAELLERIRVLEEQVRSQNSAALNATISGKPQADQPPIVHLSTPESLHGVDQGPVDFGAPLDDEIDNDAAWLETLYSGQDFAKSRPFDRISFRVCSVQQMKTVEIASSLGSRRIQFPPLAEARLLVDRYVRFTNHIHHTVHIPTLWRLVDELYSSLARQSPIRPGPAALILSVIASGSYYSLPDEEAPAPFATRKDGQTRALIWIRDVEDIIDIAHRTTKVSIEGCQALIAASFIVADSEGLSMRFRSQLSLTMLMARRLGLHQMDSPQAKKQTDIVATETGRCVWWYIATTDWIIAQRLTGADRGVYSCNPRHMNVLKPANIEDDDLSSVGLSAAKPLSWPTSKSYVLHRIRLAEINRKISDRSALMAGSSSGLTYEAALDIDLEMEQMVAELPAYFTSPVSQLKEQYSLDEAGATRLRQQGHLLRSHIMSQRALVHFPWFLRSYTDPQYSSSHEICLTCAREAIRQEAAYQQEGLCTAGKFKFICVMMCLFRATVILLVDMCRSRLSQHGTARIRNRSSRDIVDALKLLETARADSGTASRFLDSLSAVMQKHSISSPGEQSYPQAANEKNQWDSAQNELKEQPRDDLQAMYSQSQTFPLQPIADFATATTSTVHDEKNPTGTDMMTVGLLDNGLFPEEMDFSPGSFSHQLNQFVESLESNNGVAGTPTWNDIFAGWEGI